MFNALDDYGNNCFHYVCMNNLSNFKSLVECKYFKNEILFKKNLKGVTPILYGFGVPEIGDYIIKNDFVNSEELNYITNYNNNINSNILYSCIYSLNIEYFKRIFNLSYINKNKMLIENKNTLIIILKNNFDLFKEIFKIYPKIKELIDFTDIDKMNYVMLLLSFSDISLSDKFNSLKYLFDKNLISEDNLYKSDIENNYLIHYSLKYSVNLDNIEISKLIYDNMDERIFKILNNENKTFLNIISNIYSNTSSCKLTVNNYISFLEYILNSDKLINNINLIKDDIYKLIFNVSSYSFMKILKSIILTDIFANDYIDLLDVINYKTEDNETILDYTSSECLKYLLDNNFIREDIFNNLNDNYYKNSNYFLKYIYLGELSKVKLLSEYKYFTEEMFHWCVFENNDSNNIINCIHITTIDTIDIVITEYLLNHDYINLKDFKVENKYKQNVLIRMILCLSEEEITDRQIEYIHFMFDKIISKDFITKEFINLRDNLNMDLFMYLCMYSYTLAKRLLESEKFDKDNLLKLTSTNISVLEICYKNNNKISLDILNNNILTNENINNIDNYKKNIFHYISNISCKELEIIFENYNVNLDLLFMEDKSGNIPFVILGGANDVNLLKYIFDLNIFKEKGKDLFKKTDRHGINIKIFCNKKE